MSLKLSYIIHKIGFAISIMFYIAALVFLWFAGVNPYNLLMCIWWPAIMIIEYTILFLWFTSIPIKYVLYCLSFGASIVPFITWLIQLGLNYIISGTSIQKLLSSDELFGTIDLQASVIAPITEELTKLLPVIIIFISLLKFKRYRLLSPVDFSLMGLASGAGFDIFENILRVLNDYYDTIGLYRTSVMQPEPGLLNYLFPCMIKSEYLGNPMVWFGHAGTTGFICLAFGYFIYFKRKKYVFIPLLAYLICVFDHSMWNWYQPYPEQLWAKILPPITLYGRLVPFAFFIGLILNSFIIIKHKNIFKQELNHLNVGIKESSNPLSFYHIYKKLNLYLLKIKKRNQLINALRHYIKRGFAEDEFDYIVANELLLIKNKSC